MQKLFLKLDQLNEGAKTLICFSAIALSALIVGTLERL